MNGVWSEFAEEGLMNKFDVFLINFGYVCGSYKTLKQAIKMGKKTGFSLLSMKTFLIKWYGVDSEKYYDCNFCCYINEYSCICKRL